jgi:hypothetical protein
MPSSLAEFHEWFRKELQRLPEKTRGAVWCALETNSPRQIFVELDALEKAGDLPAPWGEMLTDYYSKFF